MSNLEGDDCTTTILCVLHTPGNVLLLKNLMGIKFGGLVSTSENKNIGG